MKLAFLIKQLQEIVETFGEDIQVAYSQDATDSLEPFTILIAESPDNQKVAVIGSIKQGLKTLESDPDVDQEHIHSGEDH